MIPFYAGTAPARMHVLGFLSQKGGVSKTTSAINVAACLAEYGQRVLLVDFDPQGAATVALGFEPDAAQNMFHVLMGERALPDILLPTTMPRVTLAPADIELAGAEVYLAGQAGWDRLLQVELDKVAAQFDYCLLDAPPSLGILSQSVLINAHVVIVPLQCQFLSLRALKQLLRIVQKTIQRVKPAIDLLIFRAMYDARAKQSKGVSAEIARIAGDRLLRTTIHQAADLQNATAQRQSILQAAKSSRAASEYRALTKEIMEYVEKKSAPR
jgi:chromosome partitioning protein